MMLRISTCALVGVAAMVAGSTTAAKESPDPKHAKELALALQGRTAGEPVNCMPSLRGMNRMQIIDDNTILFRDGSTVYLQKPRGGCSGIENGRYTLVIRQVGAHQVCRGDIHELVDLQNDIKGGTCVFGPFVPYRKAN